MQILVFVTEDDAGHSTGPTLFLTDDRKSVLPPHPRALEWKYFATISEDDELFASNVGGKQALDMEGFYIANKLI